MLNKTYQLETLGCPTCMTKIESMLKRTKGVVESEVLFNSSRVKVSFDENEITSEDLKERLADLGYPVLKEK